METGEAFAVAWSARDYIGVKEFGDEAVKCRKLVERNCYRIVKRIALIHGAL